MQDRLSFQQKTPVSSWPAGVRILFANLFCFLHFPQKTRASFWPAGVRMGALCGRDREGLREGSGDSVERTLTPLTPVVTGLSHSSRRSHTPTHVGMCGDSTHTCCHRP
jgi:hypothetical protein